MSDAPDLSIVIPAYNEEARLGATLDELAVLAATEQWDLEVVVVDDGSTDRTAEIAAKHLAAFPAASVIPTSRNRGKGHAVRVGMLAARGNLRMFMDADGSTSLDEIPRFVDCSRQQSGEHVLIGSIAVPGASVAPQPWYRQLAGRVANWLIRLLVLPGIKDSQRGFKLFTAGAAEDVFRRGDIDGWLFDVEALALARRLRIRILEIPITWEHREASRVSMRSYGQTLADLLRIRWRIFRGYYGTQNPGR
jgi:dolichyl-phosphate beta-glucosyltransferase